MNIQRFPSILRSLLLFSTIMLISGCSDFAGAVRKITYPPDFKYVTGQELRSRMEQMAFQLQLLDQALAENNVGRPAQQQQVLGSLRNIRRIASNLQAGEAGSSHPFLQDFMKEFVSDVEQARNTAALDPPSYYFAGRVAGGCVNCHRVNR
jgi:hypothetical protein